MLTPAMVYLLIVLGLIVFTLLFAWMANKNVVQRVYESFSWLMKVSLVDPVHGIIFIRPWKKYASQTAIATWLILALVAGRYLFIEHPKLEDIPGPYIPMIGYIFLITAVCLVKFSLQWLLKAKKDSG